MSKRCPILAVARPGRLLSLFALALALAAPGAAQDRGGRPRFMPDSPQGRERKPKNDTARQSLRQTAARQHKPPGKASRRPQPGDRPGRPPGAPPGMGRRNLSDRPLMERVLGRPPFLPAPEDFGPLRPGEARELLRFVRDRVPRVFRALRELRQRPEEQRRHLERIAPHLRNLRRLFEQDPRLARRLVRYMENRLLIDRRAPQAWQHAPPARRARIRDELRGRIAENLRIEIDVLRDRIDRLEESRDDLLERMLDVLLDPQTDLSGQPPVLRDLVRRLRAAPQPQQRDVLLERLRDLCARRLDAELDTLRERYQRMRRDADRIVERQLAEWIRRTESGPRGHEPVASPPAPPDRP